MTFPRVIFRYSWIYDQMCKGYYKDFLRKYPSTKRVLDYIKKVEPMWRRRERKVLSEMSKISGLKWKSKSVYCYVVGISRPFSDPLTMPVYPKHPDYFIDVLVHEMIHQLFIQGASGDKFTRYLRYSSRKYKGVSHTARIHIPLHAIHSHIYAKFFEARNMRRDINISKNYKDYATSWKIVCRDGYENIIRDFVKRTK